MEIPKFLLGDNSDFQDNIFIIHTEFPRFCIDLTTDEVSWMEEFEKEDERELEGEMPELIKEATAFYDREVARYENE